VSPILIVQAVPYVLGNSSVFKRESRNKWMCMKAHGKVFGVWSREETINEEILYETPSSKCVTFVQVDFWENERNKGNQHGFELALLGFDCQVANPTHLWSTGGVVSNIGFGRSGCYLSMLAISLKTGYYKEPESSPTWDLPRYMKKGKFKWRWERRLSSGQIKLTPSGWKIKTFSWGERRLIRGRTSCVGAEK
jgi:hypothetical protein